MAAVNVTTRAVKGSALTHPEMDSNWNVLAGGAAYIGSIFAWPVSTPPSDHLECNGQAVSRVTYADLFELLGTAYGEGDGSTTFNIPDLRGEFIRGWSNGRSGVDTGRALGSFQDHQLENHQHFTNVTNAPPGSGDDHLEVGNDGNVTGPVNPATANVGSETRPRNVALMWVIKAL